MMSHEFVKVKRESMASCMTCPLCHKLFKNATTVVECLHTFCRKCIYKKLSDNETENCPVCNVHLGCVPLDKLRPDRKLQAIRDNAFPSKSITVKAAEITTPITFPVTRKKKSLSSLMISTSEVSTKRGVVGRKSKFSARKTSRGSRFNNGKSLKESDDYSESSSSMEVLNKYPRNAKKNSFATGPFVDPNLDKGKEKMNQTSKRKVGPCKQLNCLVEATNKSKRPKFSKQVSIDKSEVVNSYDNVGLTNKEKGKEKLQNSVVHIEISDKEDIGSEPETQKKPKRGRKKARNFRKPTTIPPQVVLNSSNAQNGLRNHPVWFSLIASDTKEGNCLPLPQISANYIRIKDGGMPVSFIQNYIKEKLDLTSEDEVEIKCMGQRVIPTSTLNDLLEMWLQTNSAERVSTTIGSSAKDFVMVLSYARGFPDLNMTPTISLSP